MKYNLNIDTSAIVKNLKRLVNQIYKLLPYREEGADWQRPLSTIIEELCGMSAILNEYHYELFMLLCKLEGLYSLDGKDDFQSYRRTIFECLNIIGGVVQQCQVETIQPKD